MQPILAKLSILARCLKIITIGYICTDLQDVEISVNADILQLLIKSWRNNPNSNAVNMILYSKPVAFLKIRIIYIDENCESRVIGYLLSYEHRKSIIDRYLHLVVMIGIGLKKQ
jgi:hypothetical protein